MKSDALTEIGSKLFPRLQKFSDFILVGGTALALQIEHRLSVDFDLFMREELPDRLLQKIKKVFHESKITVTYNVPGQMNLDVDGMKITFFQYEYPFSNEPIQYHGVSLANVADIAVMKAFALGKRMSYKDYVDWYFLLHEDEISLADVIDKAKQRYAGDFNDRLFLGQLTSVREIEEIPITFLRDSVYKSDIASFLNKKVQEFMG